MNFAEFLDEPFVVEEGVPVEPEGLAACEAELLREPVVAEAPARALMSLGEWMVLIAAREESAMRKLHRAVEPDVLRVVSRIVQDSYLADEVVGECFWQVWRDASHFDAARGSVTSWVTTIARSRALDAVRRRKVLASREERLTEQHEDCLAYADESPPARLETRQRDRRLDAALARIDPIQRQLLSLSFVGGLSHEQVAEHCGLALGTVKSHIRRGLAQMRMQCVRSGLQP